MNSTELPAIAVIADAHCHDVDSDYGLKATPLSDRQACLRSWHDSRHSSRVFNESAPALRTALEDIRRRGIRHVVLPGDYTDDGQREATVQLRRLLEPFVRDGIAFYVIPGNHDAYATNGKHRSTRFVRTAAETVLVSSDPGVAASEDDAMLSSGMYCPSTADALQAMAEFGLCQQTGYRYWETPFGTSDAIEARCHEACSADGTVSRQLVDASYLVEPVAGLWLLMIDANVFEPRNGHWRESQKRAFHDCSDAGWNALLQQRRHLLPWIENVCSRARRMDKLLLAFSHYPVMDPFDDRTDSESRLFGNTSLRRRRPSTAVAQALLEAGLQLHMGGHLHVNGYRQHCSGNRCLTDVSLPSTAAFPAAYQIIHPALRGVTLETIPLTDMPLNPDLMAYYRAEVKATGAAEDSALRASDYGNFLYGHMQARTKAVLLPRDWPPALAEALQESNVADIARFLLARRSTEQALVYGKVPATLQSLAAEQLCSLCLQDGLDPEELEACPSLQLIVDWYCLRQAGYQACSFFTLEHTPVYAFLARHFGDLTAADTTEQAGFLQVYLGVLQQLLLRSIPGSNLSIRIEMEQLS